MKKKYVISTVVICLLVASIVFFMKFNNNSSATTANNNTNNTSTKAEANNNANDKSEENKKVLEKTKNEEKEASKNIADVSDDNKAKDKVKELLSILYFNKGNYSDYKKLFVFNDRVMSEDKFTAFRKDASKKMESSFGKSYSDVDDIMKSLSVKHEKNTAVVSFKDSKGNETVKWNVVEKQGRLYIYNAILR